MTELRSGVRVGVDVGSVRVGVAASDPTGAVVLPVTTLARGAGTVAELAALVGDRAAVEVVVGLPLGLSGREGPAAVAVRAFAADLAAAVAPVPLRLVDERFSTTSATRELQPGRGRPARRERGRAGRGDGHLDSRALRSVIDQQAAAIILRTALATEDATGAPPGELVTGPLDRLATGQPPCGPAPGQPPGGPATGEPPGGPATGEPPGGPATGGAT